MRCKLGLFYSPSGNAIAQLIVEMMQPAARGLRGAGRHEEEMLDRDAAADAAIGRVDSPRVVQARATEESWDVGAEN